MRDIFQKKGIDECLDNNASNKCFKRVLSPIHLIFLGVGAIIGAGIFIVVGEASVTAGPAVILSFILAGVVCGFTALCYAEMASLIPTTGGVYTYTYVTMGEVYAWVIGWVNIFQYIIVASTVAIGWSAYTTGLLNSIGIFIPAFITSSFLTGNNLINLPAFLIVLALTGILIKGTSESAKFNLLIVIIKVFVILLFIIVGFHYINPINYYPFAPKGLFGVLQGAAMVFFAYMGFDTVATAAEEAKNPQKALPIGIMGSLVISSILYILVSMVMIGMVHYSVFQGSAAPIQLALQNIGAMWIMTIVTIGAIAGLTTVILVSIFVPPRIIFAMSRDKLLNPRLAQIHPKHQTPTKSIVLFGIAAALVAAFAPIGIFEMANITALTTFIFIALNVILLRKQKPDIIRPFKCPFTPIIPILSIIISLILIIQIKAIFIAAFFLWTLTGLTIYFIHKRKKP